MAITKKDIVVSAAALAALVILGIVAIAGVFMTFLFGSPLIFVASLAGIGIVGLVFLIGIVIGAVMLWYVLYAFIKQLAEKKEHNVKGDYSIGRIKEAR